jgi:hypothetical protein
MAGKNQRCLACALATAVLVVGCMLISAKSIIASPAARTLWAHDNLLAWCVVPFDAKKRGPEGRAQMLAKLGIKHFAYDWRDKDIPTFDAEIDALEKHRIEVLGWWFPLDADSPMAKATLEVFRRHNIHPQLWVDLLAATPPRSWADVGTLMPKGFPTPKNDEDYEGLPQADKAQLRRVLAQLDSPRTTKEQIERVQKEANRI